MYTGTEVFNMSIAVLDELSDTGAIVDSQVIDHKNRAPYLLDAWQHEMAKNGDMFKTFELSCFRKNNLLGDTTQFRTEEFTGTDQTYEVVGANCFYFGVDSAATVYIEELIGATWTAVPGTYIQDDGTPTAFTGTINASTTTSSFSYYKGIISPTSPLNRIRLRFSGAYYYRHNNRALCPYKFATADKVPDFKPWYKATMPADFKSRTQVIDEFPDWQYETDSSHKWEGNNELYIQFAYQGIIRIKYIPEPVKITTLTQTLEVDETTAISGAYYLAQHFFLADQNTDLATICQNKYAELKRESMIKQPLSVQQVVDVYNVGNMG